MYEEKIKETETKFENVKWQLQQKEMETQELKEELLRLQGEFRILNELIQNTRVVEE